MYSVLTDSLEGPYSRIEKELVDETIITKVLSTYKLKLRKMHYIYYFKTISVYFFRANEDDIFFDLRSVLA